MASLETRPNSFRIVWRQDGRKQAESFETKPGALHFLASVEEAGNRWPVGWVKGAGPRDSMLTESERAELGPATAALTVGEMVTAYLQSDRHGMNPAQASKALHRLELHGRPFWAVPVAEIDRTAIQGWLDALGERLAVNTVAVLRSNLSSAMKDHLVETGIARVNPVTGTRIRAKASGRESVYLSQAQFDSILAELASDPALALMAELLVSTGMRSGEMRALIVSDLDLGSHPAVEITKTAKSGADHRAVIGIPKSNRSRRTVTIDPELAGMLSAYVRGMSPDASVFGIVRQAKYNTVVRHWNAAVKRAGLGRTRLHDLRHTHASWLLADHASLFEVSRRLGHATIDITANTYGHLDRHSDRANADRIGAMRSRARAADGPRLRVVS